MDKVDEKSQPFTQEMFAEILLGKYVVAAKEKLEAQVGWYKHSSEMALRRLKQYYLSDTLNPTIMDSLADLLAQENGLQEKYELAFLYMDMGQWTEAESLLNNIAGLNTLNAQQQLFYDDLREYADVLSDLHLADTGFNGLTEIQKQVLTGLANNSDKRAGSYARNVLMYLEEYNYDEPILLPEEGLKSGKAFEMTGPVIKSYPKVKLYPNPTRDYVVVEILTGNVSGAEINIIDVQGKLVRVSEIPRKKQQNILSLKGMNPGIYLVQVKYSGEIIGTAKLSISE
ncbi:MAG: T9SS type A sorting domain-containing protein [Bacteroidales bacterium]